MTAPKLARLVQTTALTKFAIIASVVTIASSLAFLLARYARLPWLLPVHFTYNGLPNGWQYKTYGRVLLPVFIQIALVLTLGAVGALLLSRAHGEHDEQAPDVKAAATAAETVALLALIWVAFQGYAAVALAAMWQLERAGLGPWYYYLEAAGVLLTVIVSRSAGSVTGSPFTASSWKRV